MRCTWPHWRETTRKGERVIVSPDGARVYYGTAKEVRDAALLPRRRNELAAKLRFRRRMAGKCGDTPEELADRIRKERRGAISRAGSDAKTVMQLVPMTEAEFIQLNAGARLLGQTFEGYWDGVIEGLFDTLLDVAEQKTGKREIPLTRHERAALARCEAATKDERKGTENHEEE